MPKNLITGGLGFLGCHLAQQLLRQGEEVILFDVLPASTLVKDIKEEAKIVRGDLANWAQVLDAVKSNEVDCIYHCGAILPPFSDESPSAAFMGNVIGTFNLLEAARLFGVASVIFTSALSTFGPGASPMAGDDALQKPTHVYGITKLFGESLGEYYYRELGVNFRAVRFPSILGPGRHGGFASYASLMIEKSALGQPFTVAVNETTQIALIYFKDAVHSLVRLKQADDVCLTRRVYNLQGFAPSAKEIADTVRRHLPKARIEFRPSEAIIRKVSGLPIQPDDTNARKDWGWKPEYNLDKAVQDFLVEVRANRARYERIV